MDKRISAGMDALGSSRPDPVRRRVLGLDVVAPESIPSAVFDELTTDLQSIPPAALSLIARAGYRVQIFPGGQAIPGAEDALGYTDPKQKLIQLREEALTPAILKHYRLAIHELGHAFEKALLDTTIASSILGPAGVSLGKSHYDFTRENFTEASRRPFLDGKDRPGSIPLASLQHAILDGPIFLNHYSSTERAEHFAESFEAYLTGVPKGALTPQDRHVEATMNRSHHDLERCNTKMAEHLKGLFQAVETLLPSEQTGPV